tara:strand:+ start:791 stop:1360 length:570 start_codon:yes stop_codon:yes gene_type:complete
LTSLSDDPDVGAILIIGAGQHFCAGQDFNDIVLGTDHASVKVCRNTFNDMVTPIFEKIQNMDIPVVAARYMDIKKTLQYLLTGEPLPAREAQRHGMVHYVVPDDELEERAYQLAAKAGAKTLANPLFVKELGTIVLYQCIDMERSKASRYAHEAPAHGFCSPEAIKGAQDFLDRKYSKAEVQLDGYLED